MATKTKHNDSNMTLAELETTCNTDELNIGGQLQSLDTVKNTNGKDVTEAVYDKSKKNNLGNLSIKKAVIASVSGKSLAFTGSAFDSGTAKDVNVFR